MFVNISDQYVSQTEAADSANIKYYFNKTQLSSEINYPLALSNQSAASTSTFIVGIGTGGKNVFWTSAAPTQTFPIQGSGTVVAVNARTLNCDQSGNAILLSGLLSPSGSPQNLVMDQSGNLFYSTPTTPTAKDAPQILMTYQATSQGKTQTTTYLVEMDPNKRTLGSPLALSDLIYQGADGQWSNIVGTSINDSGVIVGTASFQGNGGQGASQDCGVLLIPLYVGVTNAGTLASDGSGLKSGWQDKGNYLGSFQFQACAAVANMPGFTMNLDIVQNITYTTGVAFTDGSSTYCAPAKYLTDQTKADQINARDFLGYRAQDFPHYGIDAVSRNTAKQVQDYNDAIDFIRLQIGTGPHNVVAQVNWSSHMEQKASNPETGSRTFLTIDASSPPSPLQNKWLPGVSPTSTPAPGSPLAIGYLHNPENWTQPTKATSAYKYLYPPP